MQGIVQDLNQAKEVAYASFIKDINALGVKMLPGLHGTFSFFLGDCLCTASTIIIMSRLNPPFHLSSIFTQ